MASVSRFSTRSTAREPLRPPWRRKGAPPIARFTTTAETLDPACLPCDAEELVVHAPMLRAFGPELPCAPRLRSLLLDTLALRDLELPPLPELRNLHVISNALIAVPALDAPRLTHLRVIYASELERLPDPLPPRLREVHLRAGLTSLASMAGLTELRSLKLERTRLAALPELPASLEYLGLEGGAFVGPDALLPMGRLSALRDFALTWTPIAALPPTLGGLTNLLGLDLTGSAVASLPSELGGCASLQVVLLVDNKVLEAMPSVLFDLPALREVDVTRTRIPPSEWARLERATGGRAMVFAVG